MRIKKEEIIIPLFLVLAWSALISVLYFFAWQSEKAHSRELILLEARSFFSQIVITRQWNSMHGGVYVPVTDDVLPNPYLDIPDRDIVTTEGTLLTKINPAYMTRQISEIAGTKSAIHFNITSLNPLRPENKADEWETFSLNSFEYGQKETHTFVGRHNGIFFRYMAPLITDSSCLQCHAVQGYKLGDIRGGISITIPAEPVIASENRRLKYLGVLFALILAVGGAGILFSSYKIIHNKRLAQEANRAKGMFLAGMSHEIRTPMNAIINMAELAMQTELSSRQFNYIQTVRDSALSLLNIINDILDFSKIDALKLDLETVNFDLYEVLDSVKSMFLSQAAAKGLNFSVDIDPDVDRFFLGDPVRLLQVIVNLTGNAIKFTDTGSILITVKTIDRANQTPDNSNLLFCVSDTGTGIAHDKQKSVFESFSQADTDLTRKHQGTGLGLAICKRLVEMMNGRIWVESSPGKGSSFFFSTVFQKGSPEKASSDKTHDVTINISRKLKILLAEDNPINIRVATELLERMGHTIVSVTTGKEAITTLNNNDFDMVLMDIGMPDMDGMEATKQIREGKAGKKNIDITIIAVTAHAISGFKEQCIMSGMNDYISKPFNFKSLSDIIEKHASNITPKQQNDKPSAQDITDKEKALKILGGDKKLYTKLLNIFLGQIPAIKEDIEKAIEQKDFKKLKITAHKYKSSAATLGYESAVSAFNKIEQAAIDNDLEKAGLFYKKLLSELDCLSKT